MWPLACFHTLHRGLSVTSLAIFKQNFVCSSVVTSLEDGEQLETLTAASCCCTAGLTDPGVAPALLGDVLPYADKAAAERDKVPGPLAVRHCIQRGLRALAVPWLQGLGAKI